MYWVHGTHSKAPQIKPQQVIFCSKEFPLWLTDAWEQIQDYLMGRRVSLDFPHEWLEKNPQKISAWKQLKTIPYGKTISYLEFAQLTGLNHSRLAGRVLSQNPFPLLYPCHRVIRSDKTMGGFTPLLSIKEYLLTLERHSNAH